MQGDGRASVFICQRLATFLHRQNQHGQLELDWDQYKDKDEAENNKNNGSFYSQKHHDLIIKHLSWPRFIGFISLIGHSFGCQTGRYESTKTLDFSIYVKNTK